MIAERCRAVTDGQHADPRLVPINRVIPEEVGLPLVRAGLLTLGDLAGFTRQGLVAQTGTTLNRYKLDAVEGNLRRFGLSLQALEEIPKRTDAPHNPVTSASAGQQRRALSGADAWGRVCKALGRYGAMNGKRARFSDDDGEHQRILATLDTLGVGWASLCRMRLKDREIAFRNRFIQSYQRRRGAA